MSDEDRWRDSEPPLRGPSSPPELRFSPLGVLLGVFSAIAIPAFVWGYTRPGGASATIMIVGAVVGLVLGVIAAVWVAGHDDGVWRGPSQR